MCLLKRNSSQRTLSDIETFEKIKMEHQQELEKLKNQEEELLRRQEMVELRQQLVEQRCKVERLAMAQKLAEKEMTIQVSTELLQFKKQEKVLEQKEAELKKEVKECGLYVGNDEKEESEDDCLRSKTDGSRTEAWVKGLKPIQGWETRSVPDNLQQEGLVEDRMGGQMRSMVGLTNSQRKIQLLEAEVNRYKSELQGTKKNKEQAEGIRQIQNLKQMGIMHRDLPDNQFVQAGVRKDLEMTGGIQRNMKPDEEGKHDLLNCNGCGEKNKLKLGKYVKTNLSIQRREQWLHINIMRKYTKRTSFDQMEFEAFVAGETRIIYNMEKIEEAWGRLKLLCKIAHWLCRCRNWILIRGLYKSIIESIELGEEDWTSDFSHYESMIPCATQEGGRNSYGQAHREKSEIFWCKPFQKGSCVEAAPYMVTIKTDEPPVPVLHICAAC